MGGWAGDYFSETGSGDDALIPRYVEEMASLPQVVLVGHSGPTTTPGSVC
ncbi:MAG: hypothetical protein R3C44_03510 [Chloroflexota bacterium]